MKLFLVLIALLAERFRSPSARSWLADRYHNAMERLETLLGGGEHEPVLVTCVLGFLLPGVGYLVLNGVLVRFQPLLGTILSFVVLWLTLQFRSLFDDLLRVQHGLRHGPREPLIHELGLADFPEPDEGQIVARAIERLVIALHQGLLAPLFWFGILGGFGVVLHLAALALVRFWAEADPEASRLAHRIQAVIDWIPLRLTALSFAIVGNFEDALYSWRSQAAGPRAGVRIILASAAGALGTRLGDASLPDRVRHGGLDLGVGDLPPEPDHLRTAEGMAWRALLLWMLVYLLLSLAGRS